MARLGGHLTPAARAKLELLLNRWAAPGIHNPADPDSPHATDTPDTDSDNGSDNGSEDALEQARRRDHRHPDQRNHDAFEAMLDFVLAHHGLGRPDHIPAEVVITVSDTDLADIDALGSACGGHNRWVGPHPGQWETDIQRDGPHAGRMIWRPTGTTGPWQLNPTRTGDLIHTRNPHAPPNPAHHNTSDPIRANDSRSRHDKDLEARLGLTLLAS